MHVGPYDKIRNIAAHNENICKTAASTYKGNNVVINNLSNTMEDIKLRGRINTILLTSIEN